MPYTFLERGLLSKAQRHLVVLSGTPFLAMTSICSKDSRMLLGERRVRRLADTATAKDQHIAPVHNEHHH